MSDRPSTTPPKPVEAPPPTDAAAAAAAAPAPPPDTFFTTIRRFSDHQVTAFLQSLVGLPSPAPSPNFVIDDESAAYQQHPVHRRANSDVSDEIRKLRASQAAAAAPAPAAPPPPPTRAATGLPPAENTSSKRVVSELSQEQQGQGGMCSKLPTPSAALLAPSMSIFSGAVRELEGKWAEVTELDYYNFWETTGKPSAPVRRERGQGKGKGEE